jgi:hypothetical protein
MHIGYWWESQKERTHLEEQAVSGCIILKWIIETRWGSMNWIDMGQDRDRWRALAYTVMNLRFPLIRHGEHRKRAVA